jgi:hypothetical protein
MAKKHHKANRLLASRRESTKRGAIGEWIILAGEVMRDT